MFLRRRSLIILLLPAIGYTFVMYSLIGRTCKDEESFFGKDYSLYDEEVMRRDSHRELLMENPEQNVPARLSQRTRSKHRYRQRQTSTFQAEPLDIKRTTPPRYPFNCTNIPHIKLRKKIGHGVSKQTFLGEYRGQSVAVKMVTRHIHDVKNCLDALKTHNDVKEDTNGDPAVNMAAARQQCYTPSTLKLMKEILLAEQLQHPNIAALLGYCVRSEESDSTDIAEHGVVSVFELGSRFVVDSLQILPWPQRLLHAFQMADLLHYLQFSPLGSLVIPDFKEGHFVLVNSTLKMIDLDDINNIEPPCGAAVRGKRGGGGGEKEGQREEIGLEKVVREREDSRHEDTGRSDRTEQQREGGADADAGGGGGGRRGEDVDNKGGGERFKHKENGEKEKAERSEAERRHRKPESEPFLAEEEIHHNEAKEEITTELQQRQKRQGKLDTGVLGTIGAQGRGGGIHSEDPHLPLSRASVPSHSSKPEIHGYSRHSDNDEIANGNGVNVKQSHSIINKDHSHNNVDIAGVKETSKINIEKVGINHRNEDVTGARNNTANGVLFKDNIGTGESVKQARVDIKVQTDSDKVKRGQDHSVHSIHKSNAVRTDSYTELNDINSAKNDDVRQTAEKNANDVRNDARLDTDVAMHFAEDENKTAARKSTDTHVARKGAQTPRKDANDVRKDAIIEDNDVQTDALSARADAEAARIDVNDGRIDAEGARTTAYFLQEDPLGGTGYERYSDQCEYGVQCSRALCIGFNAKENLKNMNQLLFKRLLFPLTFPQKVIGEIGQINAKLDTLDMSAEELRTMLLSAEQRAYETVER